MPTPGTASWRNRIAGLGKNRKTAVFPKPAFAIRDGLNHKKGDPVTTSNSWRWSAQQAHVSGYPELRSGSESHRFVETPWAAAASSACGNENGEQIHDGRNNLGVISLNLPRIALEAKGDEATFWKLLDERLVLYLAPMTRIARLVA